MIEAADIARIGRHLAGCGEPGEPAIWDVRIDADGDLVDDAALLAHARHQTLMRAYQSRYALLPTDGAAGNAVEQLRRRYEPRTLAMVEATRTDLEDLLITPAIEHARAAALGVDWAAYADTLLRDVRGAPENPFVAFLRTSPQREDHYRNFLLQASADLLAEASASALGVIGEFGPAQSALFRILIDEFGYGVHDRKHSVLYRAVMRGFGLPDEYNACWPLFDTAALRLHNTIHCLFQNPRYLFLQIGFLLHAETAYQRSTRDHFRYLAKFHPEVDARYFGEHAHIDLHHTRMVIEEVAAPLVATHGPEVGVEIVAGAELTRQAFAQAGDQMLAVSRAFDAALEQGRAQSQRPDLSGLGLPATPSSAARLDPAAMIQVGGLGLVEAGVFATFSHDAFGRLPAEPRS
ncbi:hypothetical protein BH10PSE4_BH10PSE4_38780 [soil metagenome]